jgi:Family of unknown function (DUF5681)
MPRIFESCLFVNELGRIRPAKRKRPGSSTTRDGAGKRRLKTFKLKKPAESFAAKASVEITQGTHTPDSASITVAEAANLWLTQRLQTPTQIGQVFGHQHGGIYCGSLCDLPPIDPAIEIPVRLGPKQDTRFKPGQSGNPRGMRIGTRHKRTLLLETALTQQAPELLAKIVEMGLAGDAACLKICADRLLPPRKSMPIRFKLPPLRSVSDAQDALAQLTAGVACGKILADEAQILSGIINSFLKSIEIADLEARLVALESASKIDQPAMPYNA